ncbi:MAG: hypothetical protein COY58_08180 [Gammaproteobacteria bacterium CG_4_10_14_0_8_um_filter_38_16]|nr:MAG: hypothetical protein COY58_08180 [Gammaproteobacteria bacterium CG_4_10_14_0_8_um_filter_38_16]PJA04278.1 MAG: hypothetical protein COX72_00815 [Gammaproteobacteria bacterium CG_4_10_14_0_2_um_filter_38_22]PJB11575.1 MAG: hypothetical protein CO120_00115 [Gammaproteobacteria bacterium CG_4_9_14_3_um_filter_38_9]
MSLKNNVFSAIGGSLEWFDFALYAFFAPIFASIFFSNVGRSHLTSLIISYGIFAIGFAARPIGGLIFGYFGDKYGRLFSLRITPVLSAITSIAMALLPTYQSIGNAAIFLLILTRILQGIFIGGEFTGNIVYLCESSNKKYFWGSIGSCTGSFGILLASITASIFYSCFSKQFMYGYGWRIAFLLSIPLVIITFIMRLKISESREFLSKKSSENPIKLTFKSYKRKLFTCIGLIYLHATSFYFVFMFIPVFLNKIRHLTESAALIKNTTFLILHILFIPILGLLVNIIGGMRGMLIIALSFCALSIPLFYYICYGTSDQIIFCFLTLSIMTAFNAAIIPGLFSILIPTEVRYTILALAFNLGFGIFGGITPALCLLLIHRTGSIISPAYYIAFASAVTLTTVFMVIKHDEIRKI